MPFKKNLLILICCLGLLPLCNTKAQQTSLPVIEFEKAIGQSNIQLLDVRTLDEYQSGHLKNAMLANWNNQTEFRERINALDKNKPVYTYCLSGARSYAATIWLRENGFTAYNLDGGISAWKKAVKPLDVSEKMKQITLQEYMAQIPREKTVLVDFSAVWCPPCKKMAPVIDSLVGTHGDQFVLVKIDAGSQTDICKELKVDGFPTFIFYKNGEEIWRKQGIVALNELVKKL